MKKLLRYPRVVAAAVLLVTAAVFAAALTGYAFSALTCAGIAAALLLYELFSRRGWRRLRRALVILLCLGAVCFAVLEAPVVRAAGGEPEYEADYLIVLGAGVRGDVPSLSLKNRLDAALEYLREHPGCTAVVSGGQGPGENLSEAQAMFDYLTARGIEPERVLMEDRSTSTMENLSFSCEILRSAGVEPEKAEIAVLSSEYHLYRAQYLARGMGVELHGVAAHTSNVVLMVNYFIREAFAVLYTWIFG